MNDSNSTVYYSYDSTLKKLLQILKSKTSDNIKQLEDLWDSINKNSIQPSSSVGNKNSRTSPARSSSSQSPIHLSDSSNDSTNSSSNSSSSNLKRDASKMCPSPVNSSSSSSNSTIKKSKVENTSLLNNKTKVNTTSKSSKETDSIILNVEDSMDTSDKDEMNNMAVDMLDFSCSICRQFNQEPNNKLIECRQCTHLYHQVCHIPKIENSQLEQQQSNVANDDQLVWYLSKCNKCESENTQVDLEVDKINSIENNVLTNGESANEASTTINNSNLNSANSLLTKTNNVIKNSNGFTNKNETNKSQIPILVPPSDSWLFKKEKTSPTNTNQKESNSCTKNSNSLSSFSNLSNNNAVNNITLNSSTNSINSNGKSNTAANNATGIKGLAGLATKLNPNGNQQIQANNCERSLPTNLKKAANPDFLFKKFKESVTSIAQPTTNENEKKNESTSNNLAKKALIPVQIPATNLESKKSINSNGLTNLNTNKSLVKTNITTLNGNSANNIHKKNPFNISNSLTTKTSNSCSTLSNLKDKKTNLKSSNIPTTTAITANTSNNTNSLNRSSKIS